MADETQARDAVRVRRAGPADAPAVLALVPRLVAFGPPPWRDPEAMVAVDAQVIFSALQNTGDDPLVLVAEAEARIIGFVHLRSLVDHYIDRPHGHVADLVVAKGEERQGIATRLIAAGEDWARAQGFDRLTIAVFTQNAGAAKLYERVGFARDIVRMVKLL